MIDPANPGGGSAYGPTRPLNFELEVAFVVGKPTNIKQLERGCNSGGGSGGGVTIGRPMTAGEARERIFGYVLMNDWSARNVQKWEYVPLSPFTLKNFAMTISLWIIMIMALEPYCCTTSATEQGRDGSGDPILLEYLRDHDYGELPFLFFCIGFPVWAPLRKNN
jgi:fumarylacetoacetase